MGMTKLALVVFAFGCISVASAQEADSQYYYCVAAHTGNPYTHEQPVFYFTAIFLVSGDVSPDVMGSAFVSYVTASYYGGDGSRVVSDGCVGGSAGEATAAKTTAIVVAGRPRRGQAPSRYLDTGWSYQPQQ